MTASIISQLLANFDQPEHLPSLLEMSSNMIVLCAEKCYDFKQSKVPQTKTTPFFSKLLRVAHHNHRKICQDWRKAGRPTSDDHPSKLAKKLSQRNLQKITREEESKEAVNFHEDLMNTHKDNMSGTCQKLKKVRGDNLKSTLIPEIETFLGTYTGENVLEGFRANTEYLCNEQPNDKFSSEFLDR